MTKMKLTPFNDLLDEHIGKIGTPKRDEFERKVEDSVMANMLGEVIKRTRKEQKVALW